MKNSAQLSPQNQESLLKTLAKRFEKNRNRHPDLSWNKIETKLLEQANKLWSLHQMEISGGEPDVVAYSAAPDEYVFFDCSQQSPSGRRSLCYDKEALESRKENKPMNSVLQMALDMNIELLSEEEYRYLQTLGDFDTKTSSWVKTPAEIRMLGGAIFCDKRYNHVFTYHNGAESYYAARGFRASLKI